MAEDSSAVSAAAAPSNGSAPKSGRSGRPDPRQNDPRRYHTAGAIEDMKKHDSPGSATGAGVGIQVRDLHRSLSLFIRTLNHFFLKRRVFPANKLVSEYTTFDSPLQKRLSWNYGQHIPNNDLQLKTSTVAASSAKCLSSDSMQSSSGVSSTGSLHLSIGSTAGGGGGGEGQQWNPVHLRQGQWG